MRCLICGWVVTRAKCPCGETSRGAADEIVQLGATVLARHGRGPSVSYWERGEVRSHVGAIHGVETRHGMYWCEARDLLADSPQRDALVVASARVWGLWVDGRWYPGMVVAVEGPLRRVRFDDQDSQWMEARNIVVMATRHEALDVGAQVVALGWDGRRKPGVIEEVGDGGLYRVTFEDGEDAWVNSGDLEVEPQNPFLDGCDGAE